MTEQGQETERTESRGLAGLRGTGGQNVGCCFALGWWPLGVGVGGELSGVNAGGLLGNLRPPWIGSFIHSFTHAVNGQGWGQHPQPWGQLLVQDMGERETKPQILQDNDPEPMRKRLLPCGRGRSGKTSWRSQREGRKVTPCYPERVLTETPPQPSD